MNPLRGYQGEDIEIQLPGDLTVKDIDWLAVWCITFRENFGHVLIPKDLDVPPALGQNQLTVTRNSLSLGLLKHITQYLKSDLLKKNSMKMPLTLSLRCMFLWFYISIMS